MMGGPKEMLGTKWPSMTSRWRKSAPAAKTSSISAPSLAKSAERMEGARRGEVVENGLGAMGPPSRMSGLIQDVQRGEVAVLQELQRGAAAGGDVGDFVGQAHLLDGGGA